MCRCILVTGIEYKDVALREKVKALGASWCKELKGWVLLESARTAVQAVLDGGEPSPKAVAAAGAGATVLDPSPSENAGAKLNIAPHKKAILVMFNLL